MFRNSLVALMLHLFGTPIRIFLLIALELCYTGAWTWEIIGQKDTLVSCIFTIPYKLPCL